MHNTLRVDDGNPWEPQHRLHAGGKLDARPLTVLATLGDVQITNYKLHFLIDTGADISVLPLSSAKGNVAPANLKVYAANGTPIPTFGSRTLTLNLGLRRPYTWTFMVARVQQPIIGYDFLRHHGLLVETQTQTNNRRLHKDVQTRTAKYINAAIHNNYK